MMQFRRLEGQVIEVSKQERAVRDWANRQEALERVMRAGDSDPWFAIRVMTGCEQAVEKELGTYEIEAMVPMRKGKDWERRGRRIEGRMMPVVHGYVLVRFVPDIHAMQAVSTIDKVLGFLRAGEKPKRISHCEVLRFHRRAMAGDYDWRASTPAFAKGQRVRVVDGPFEGFEAEVVTPKASGKGDMIVVSVEIFGTTTPVTLPLAMIEKL